MRVEICGPGVGLGEAARAGVRRRIASALGRFARRVARVRVNLAALSGPRGGIGKQCRAVVDLVRAGQVLIKHRAAHWTGAVGGAAERLARAVQRRLSRRRRRPRAGGPASHEQPDEKEV